MNGLTIRAATASRTGVGRRSRCAITGWALLLCCCLPSAGFAGAALTVNSLADFNDYSPGDGACSIDAQTATCSLRAAIQEANANAAFDTVLFQGGLSGEISLSLGEMPITSSLVVQGPGPDVLTVDAEGLSRHFTFTGVSLELSGLRLTGGDAGSGNGAGSLYVQPPADSVQLSNLRFEGNQAESGGAVAVLSITPLTELILESVALVGNTAESRGGALFVTSDTSLHVTDSSFVDNQSGDSESSLFGDGGAIFFSVTGDAAVSLQRSTFTGNQVIEPLSYGGAVSLQSVGAGEFTLDVDRCSFVDNSSPSGGAFSLFSVTGSITNSTLGDNQAASGGALYAWGSTTMTLANCTVAGNGGGGAALDTTGAATTTLGHTLIADDLAACAGTAPTSLGYNIASDASCSLAATGDQASTDPLLGPLHSTGVTSPAFVPYTSSPAVDSGDPAGCPSAALVSVVFLSVDQWGQSRPWDGDSAGGAQCDRGAIETHVLFYDGFEDGTYLGWSSATS